MNKKYLNIALISLLFCTVHNSNGTGDSESNSPKLTHPNLDRPINSHKKAKLTRPRVKFEDPRSDSAKLDPVVRAVLKHKIILQKDYLSDVLATARKKRILRKAARYYQNLRVAGGIKIATHLAKKSILKDQPTGSIIDKAAKINDFIRIF